MRGGGVRQGLRGRQDEERRGFRMALTQSRFKHPQVASVPALLPVYRLEFARSRLLRKNQLLDLQRVGCTGVLSAAACSASFQLPRLHAINALPGNPNTAI